MAGYQFFAGVAAGVAMLTVPVVVFGVGPGRIAGDVRAWIDGTPATSHVEVASALRPERGYVPGGPIPTPLPVPTLRPVAMPTPQASSPLPTPAALPAFPSTSVTWRAGVVRTGNGSVVVHRTPGADSPGDPVLPDGSPILVNPTGLVHVGDQDWVTIRGLSNVMGWVPRDEVVDGYTPPPRPTRAAQGPAAAPTPTAQPPDAQRARVANTDGEGVVLRASPRDEDRTPRGLLEGTTVTVLGWSGTDWVHVRADNSAEGWVPVKYLTAAS